jgi:hypothetical protein
VDPCHFHAQCCERPESRRQPRELPERSQRCRQRRCLLKGCERPFWPQCPQARYCSVACQQAAERWRKQRSSRTFRGSEHGRAQRREQARRHRQRRREQRLAPTALVAPAPAASPPAANTSAAPAPAPVPASTAPAASAAAAAPPASAAGLACCVGQRPAVGCQDFLQRRCARPGCYVWFGVAHEHASKRFCSVACRLALRRVLDREERYRARRRRWRRQRLTRRRRPADTS